MKRFLLLGIFMSLLTLIPFENVQAQEEPIFSFACVSDLHAQQDFITDPNNIRIRESATKTLSKIKTEEKLIKFKEKRFKDLKRKDIRYIKMRHSVVMAIAYKKNKSYVKCFARLMDAGLKSPFGMLGILTGTDR